MGWRPGIQFACATTCAAICLALPDAAGAAAGFVQAETLGGAGAADFGVKTAIAPNGFAIAGWVEALNGGTQTAIRVATRPPGGPWSAPQQLDPTSLSQVRYPLSVAIDAAGDAAIAWDDEQGGSPTVDTAAVATRAAGQSSFGAAEKLTGAVDPVVGIDSTGHVTMIDEELDGISPDEVDRVWSASGSLPPVRTDLVATGCRPELVPAVLAVAPGGDAIAGAQCHGDTFVRRISGAWKPKSTPAADTSSGGPCPSPPTSSSGQQMTVAIDSAGDVAGAFVEDGSSTDCLTFMNSNSYSLNLVTGTATGVSLVPSPVDTAFSMGVATGSSIIGPASAVAPGTELLAWGNGSLLATNLLARFFDSTGNPTSARETLVTAPFGADPQVAMNADGMALAVFPTADGNGLQAQTRLPGMPTFSQSVPLAAAPASNASVAIDDTGDGLVGYEAGQTTSARAQVRGFDANAPSLDAASIPPGATAGAPVTFTAHASDVWGPVTMSWDFGDGSPAATGTSVTHTYTTAGSHTVTVTATDAIGNAASTSGSITIAASSPVLSRASIKPKRFKAGHKAVITFTLNERAKVSITIAPRQHRRHRKHHLITTGKLTHVRGAGVNHVPFTGRIRKRGLAPGSYRAAIVAREGSAQSRPATVSFTILRAG